MNMVTGSPDDEIRVEGFHFDVVGVLCFSHPYIRFMRVMEEDGMK
jgi:hypothetical protein